MQAFADLKARFCQKFSDIMPQGAGALFFIQIFSTLGFSVLYSTLVLFATHALKFSDQSATAITASFVAFNYALHLLGGYLGGRYLSNRSLFGIGMIAIMIGCALISIATPMTFYWGLASFLTGCGLNVTCINCMLTQLFQPNDKRRETAFLWVYSGMNIGFFIGFSVSGYYQLYDAYQNLFLLSTGGSLIALVILFFKWKILNDRNTHYIQLVGSKKLNANLKGLGLIVLLFFGLRWILENASFSENLILTVGVGMILVISFYAVKQPTAEARHKMWAYLILAFASLAFWTLYQLAPMGLTLFIERNVERHYLGMLIAPQWVQNINTVVIIFGGPVLGMIFTALRARGVKFTIPMQFSIALLLIGIAFILLPIGIHFADARGMVNFNWILIFFILQSLGELFISPIGYAMIGQLAPNHLQGIMMGTWMMITGVAATLSGHFSNLALGNTQSTDPLITNASFSHTFSLLGWTTIAIGIALFFLVPLVLKLTQEKKIILQPIENTAGV